MSSNAKKVGFGGIVMWSLPEYVERDAIKAAVTSVSPTYTELVPGPRPPSAVLKEAMTEVFAGSHTLIRPLKSRNGFTAIKENRGENDNQYAGEFVAKVDEVTEQLTFSSSDIRKDNVEKAYEAQKGKMNNNELTALMIDILQNKLNGVSLRPRGGVYWVPGAQTEAWNKLREALANVDSSIKVYHFEHDVGPEYLKAVKDAIVRDVQSESAALKEEILGPKQLGKRALVSKKKQANALRDRIAIYEGILSTNLTELRSEVDEVDVVAGEAAILLAGSSDNT